MDILVRNANSEDLETIIQFQLAMAKETEDLGLNLDDLTHGVNNLFSNPERGLYWVAELNGQIAGSLMTNYEWSDWRNGNVIWIQSVYVSSECRNKGVFKAMYLKIKDWVEATDELKGVRLYVEKNNSNAQKVYEAMGMTSEHYTMYEWLK